MIFRNALIGHFDIWNSFSKRRWWFWHFSKGYPLEISPKWTEKKISEYQKSDLVSQNGRLIPIRFTQETMWSLSKKSHNNCLDLVDSIINTLYKLQSPRGILIFQHFELIFCVCEYFSILFTIKKAKIGKEKIFFLWNTLI